ncbi:MAG: nucleoside-diphosphate sugar epimerase/dehydratase [Planctomycetota bacterium]
MPNRSPQPDPDLPATGGVLAWFETAMLHHRFTVNVVVHAILFSLALLTAYLVRFDIRGGQDPWFVERFLPMLPIFVLVKLILFGWRKLFRSGWQYASIRDVANILLASWLFLLATWVTLFALRQVPGFFGREPSAFLSSYSEGVLILDFFATVFLVSTARLGFRLYREELRPTAAEGLRRVLIVGAGNAGETVIREINRMRTERYLVVGIVDDDPVKRGLVIHDVQVMGGAEDIPAICQDEEVDEIIIAIPTATQKQLRRVIDLCGGTKLKFRILPSVDDLIEGRMTVSQIRPVDIEDLLGRDPVRLDMEAIGRFVNDRVILITGAGGSIGSEMCRQICHFRPKRLILVEQAETPLFDIENELREKHPGMRIIPCICDIFDRERVMQVWKKHRPDVVIHAAAHKHVPLMEHNPCEAVKNNVLGTRNVADASCAAGAAEFVMISTDKAVNPSSVMGACKRVAEIYTQALNAQPSCGTQFKAVRFGNVLGSSGSVIPAFRKQIAAGGPVRVTHPDMTRYFMTIPEAAQLVLQAAATGAGGQIFLLDMGEPVKIVDLARQMITLSGFRPGEDIDIVFTGVRPGEKLFEELRTDGEDIEPTVHPKINIWKCRKNDWLQVQEWIENLSLLQNCLDRNKVIAAIREIVPEFTPLNPPREEQEVSAPTPVPSPSA